MKEIRLEHIYKDYIPGTHVVKDFNLTINEGEFIVLVGPSGCFDGGDLWHQPPYSSEW